MKIRFISILVAIIPALYIFTGCSGQTDSLLQKLGLALVDRTVWTVKEGEDGHKGIFLNSSQFIIKGVCYSPTEINGNAGDFPAIGDVFWDAFQAGGGTIWSWYGLWGTGDIGNGYYAREDINKIRDLGANAVRVYCMMSRQPKNGGTAETKYQPKSEISKGTHFTHDTFLKNCYNDGTKPVYVIVGIPMSLACFNDNVTPLANEIDFYEWILNETTKDLANDPAVLGFTIMNEQAQSGSAFYTGGTTGDAHTDYFYSQAKKYAAIVKNNAPNKLVGWAINDCPQMVKFGNVVYPTTSAQSNLDKTKTYFENLAVYFDFWGVNTYQLQHVGIDTVINSGTSSEGLAYNQLSNSAHKPVILLEYGWPSTDRDTGAIHSDATSQGATADYITSNFEYAYGKPVVEGIFYFEFSDEWWKQGGTPIYEWNGTSVPINTDAWPNGYADEEGFGLYGRERTGTRADTDPNWDFVNNCPILPVDTLIERTPMTTALKNVYKLY